MTERERAFELERTQGLRARRSTAGVVAQYIRELAAAGEDSAAAEPTPG